MINGLFWYIIGFICAFIWFHTEARAVHKWYVSFLLALVWPLVLFYVLMFNSIYEPQRKE